MPFAGVHLAGLSAAAVGIVFGLPSLRVKVFIWPPLLAHFHQWVLTKFPWFQYSASGVITAQKMVLFGYALILRVPVRADGDRDPAGLWPESGAYPHRPGLMAMRDMDVAAEVIGIPMRRPLLAFAIILFTSSRRRPVGLLLRHGHFGPSSWPIVPVVVHNYHRRHGTIVGAFSARLSLSSSPSSICSPHRLCRAVGPGMLSHLEQFMFGSLIISS